MAGSDFGPQASGIGTSPTLGGYPAQLTCAAPVRSNRFWAIPLIGILVKLIVLIPHVIVLYFLGVIVGFAQLILWIPVLFGGAYPAWGYKLVGGYMVWTIRVSGYLYGLTDAYPPFTMASPIESEAGDYPIVFSLDPASSATRWYAIPLIGILVKMILLVPHFVVLYALGIAMSLILLIAWAPVLFKGSYPRWAFDLALGYLRWAIRFQAYFFGLTDRYPPFVLFG